MMVYKRGCLCTIAQFQKTNGWRFTRLPLFRMNQKACCSGMNWGHWVQTVSKFNNTHAANGGCRNCMCIIYIYISVHMKLMLYTCTQCTYTCTPCLWTENTDKHKNYIYIYMYGKMHVCMYVCMYVIKYVLYVLYVCIVLYCIVLSCLVLSCLVLYCIVLYVCMYHICIICIMCI